MATHTPSELLKGWQREEMTTEMAIGHLIQNILKLEEVLATVNLALYQLQTEVDSLGMGGRGGYGPRGPTAVGDGLPRLAPFHCITPARRRQS